MQFICFVLMRLYLYCTARRTHCKMLELIKSVCAKKFTLRISQNIHLVRENENSFLWKMQEKHNCWARSAMQENHFDSGNDNFTTSLHSHLFNSVQHVSGKTFTKAACMLFCSSTLVNINLSLLLFYYRLQPHIYFEFIQHTIKITTYVCFKDENFGLTMWCF